MRVEYVLPDRLDLWGTLIDIQPGFWDWEQDIVPMTVLLDDGRTIETHSGAVQYRYHPTRADLDARGDIWRDTLSCCRIYERTGTPAFWDDGEDFQEIRIVNDHEAILPGDRRTSVLDFRVETGRWAGQYLCEQPRHLKRINNRFQRLDRWRKVIGVW